MNGKLLKLRVTEIFVLQGVSLKAIKDYRQSQLLSKFLSKHDTHSIRIFIGILVIFLRNSVVSWVFFKNGKKLGRHP